MEDIELLKEIKSLYYEYILSDNKKYLDELFMIYINNDISADYINKLNNIIDEYDMFLDIIYYSAFLMNYNLKYEYEITTYEKIYIDILYKNLEDSLKVYYEYKNKYIDEYVERNIY